MSIDGGEMELANEELIRKIIDGMKNGVTPSPFRCKVTDEEYYKALDELQNEGILCYTKITDKSLPHYGCQEDVWLVK